MWSFLKADLQELVAVVKEDAATLGIPVVEGDRDNETSNRIESHEADAATKIYDNEGTQKPPTQLEAERRMNIPETFTVPLLPTGVTNSSGNMNITEEKDDEIPQENRDSEPSVNKSSDTGNENDEEDDDGDKGEDEDEDEVDEYEIQEIQEYLKSFNINDEQTQQEISFLLEEYKETLQIQYDALVPNHVTHEEFWQRYFFRCDAARIQMEWNRADDELPEPRAGTKIVTSVTSFFGDAARAVATGMSNALTEDLQSFDNDEDDEDNENDQKGMSSTARVLATSLFGHTGSSHRPPFVMNTAVDEDDGEEEEEIGWDDDDEDDEEQIVFDDNTGGPVMSSKHQRSTTENDSKVKQGSFDRNDSEAALLCEQLKEQLKQAIEERDILHQTVSLQTKEIATLKSVTATEASTDAPNDFVPQDGTTETDYDGSTVSILQNQVEELNAVIRDREKLAQEMKIQYEAETRVLQDRVNELQTMNDQLQLQIAELDRTTSIERDDKIEDAKRLEAEKVELQGQLKMAQSDATVSQTKILDLERELEATQGQLKVANERLVAISNPIATTEIDEKTGTDTTTNMSSSGELTSATGVKVALPSAMVSKIPKDDDDEEGWGDDWD